MGEVTRSRPLAYPRNLGGSRLVLFPLCFPGFSPQCRRAYHAGHVELKKRLGVPLASRLACSPFFFGTVSVDRRSRP